MRCLKHGYDWSHDKVCLYCALDLLTTRLEAKNKSFRNAINVIKEQRTKIESLTTELDQACADIASIRGYTGHMYSCQTRRPVDATHCDCGFSQQFCGGCKCGSLVCTSLSTTNEEPVAAQGQPKADNHRFFVEESKGFFWITDRVTKHNHAQTDSKERANQICLDMNNGILAFEEDGCPVDNNQDQPKAEDECEHGFKIKTQDCGHCDRYLCVVCGTPRTKQRAARPFHIATIVGISQHQRRADSDSL